MILLRLNGGLGNQMFQYAFARSLAEKYEQQICIDFSEFINSNRCYSLDVFPLEPKLMVNLEDIGEIQGYRAIHLQEESLRFNTAALNAFDGYDLDNCLFLISGYWQSSKYFEKIASIIRNDFSNIYKIESSYNEIRELILTSEAVMVHVRRGDYLWAGNLQKHGVIDTTYIEKGIRSYRNKVKDARFFIFSDDPLWCKENISKSDDIIIIDQDHDEGKTSFALMRQCKYFLISNSTFSWWTAWLSEYSQKQVICPKIWFRETNDDSLDLIPSNWKKY